MFSFSIPIIKESSFSSIGNKLYFLASFSGTNMDKSTSDVVILITSITINIYYDYQHLSSYLYRYKLLF
ncbi:hypothetical protein SDC9_197919 [bioreactor metagenome]|uniref:Uncharacterized protein n=1 Tax=bioreactor metagenome TaxID=1076179 RepID=A0A645ISW2_9ZZZZ